MFTFTLADAQPALIEDALTTIGHYRSMYTWFDFELQSSVKSLHQNTWLRM